MADASEPGLPTDVREHLTRFLRGAGVELGPGHHPFRLAYPGATVQYVDRWDPDVNRDLFPELDDEAAFQKPDIVADLDTDRLSGLGDGSQDFVIASHVLEHVTEAAPARFRSVPGYDAARTAWTKVRRIRPGA